MSSLRIRPRFKLSSSYSDVELLEKISNNLKNKEDEFYAESLLTNLIIIKLKQNQHLWSPQLSLSIDKTENGCIIRGLYGPKPTIWSFFVFLYTGIGVCILFAGLYGFARVSLKMEAPILWVLPALSALAVILYLFAQIGQKLSAQQMFDIHHFFENAVDKKVNIK